MTEVAGLLLPADHRLTTVRHYEAGPPEGLQLVEPGETFATTKEEEWVSKKKTEVINTKQIETRVKRQVVLEDGKVVEDSGPQVTTNTTEDSETQEHQQTELRKSGDDADGGVHHPGALQPPETPLIAPNPDGLVREVKEKRVISRQETEEVKETEDVQHFGDITDEAFVAAVGTGKPDLRPLLRPTALLSAGPRTVHTSTKSHTTINTDDKRDTSSLLPNGKIVTESEHTTAHETITDDPLPPSASPPPPDTLHTSGQRHSKTRQQLDVDLFTPTGVHLAHEMRLRHDTVAMERDAPPLEALSAPLDRQDALTKRPLDFDREEEVRKLETNKWLEHHFGSESRSSTTSLDDDDDAGDAKRKSPPTTSFFNVTIKSSPQVTVVGAEKELFYKGISRWTAPPPQKSPVPDYYAATPTPPARKRTSERRHQHAGEEEKPFQYQNGGARNVEEEEVAVEVGRFTPPSRLQPEEPAPDYSPPERKAAQKTRFAPDPPKARPGNIIGQSIRKLVGKIRSASAERKAKQRSKRSPSPSYQKAHTIDHHIQVMDKKHHHYTKQTPPPPSVQRYYLGEDPFAGSIYGRENKYDTRPRKPQHSTLGRFSKSASRLQPASSQTLPRPDKINVSIVNTLGPAKPARTYKSNLARSRSLNVHAMPLLEDNAGLKSPALISSLRTGGGQRPAPDDPPTRLLATSPRRGSHSSTDYSETYHTTTRNDDPVRPSVTNTVKSFTKKTIPGRGTIESSEVKSVTKSHYREPVKRYGSPVVIEVRNASAGYQHNSSRK